MDRVERTRLGKKYSLGDALGKVKELGSDALPITLLLDLLGCFCVSVGSHVRILKNLSL